MEERSGSAIQKGASCDQNHAAPAGANGSPLTSAQSRPCVLPSNQIPPSERESSSAMNPDAIGTNGFALRFRNDHCACCFVMRRYKLT